MRTSKTFIMTSIAAALLTSATARASTTFVESIANVFSGPSDPFDIEHDIKGSNSIEAISGMGGAFADAKGGMRGPGDWFVFTTAQVTGSDLHHGPSALALSQVTTNILVTVSVAGHNPGDQISFTSHINTHGAISGNATAPGFFDSSIGATIDDYTTDGLFFGHDFTGSQDLSSTEGFKGAELPTDISWQFLTNNGAQFVQRVIFEGFANTFTVEDQGSAQANADFEDTFAWAGITDAFDLTTNQPIPLSDIHLIDADDGHDWSQPTPTPEPTTALLLTLALPTLLPRRRRRQRSRCTSING